MWEIGIGKVSDSAIVALGLVVVVAVVPKTDVNYLNSVDVLYEYRWLRLESRYHSKVFI